jgi:ligand-binding sensor domain-containing protein/DNA-binding CsgD family transcriptional regulator
LLLHSSPYLLVLFIEVYFFVTQEALLLKMLKKLLLFAVLFAANISGAQNTIGIPIITNHSKQDYHAGSQNWNIKQDKKGILYFANNDGLLTFDGSFWRLYELPNKIIVRSLAIADDGKIYIGSQEEIGFFSANKNGELEYTSLKKMIPEKDRDFSDVWHISLFNNSVFFLSNKKIFQLSNGKIAVYRSNNKWRFLTTTNNQLFASEFEGGLLQFQNNEWKQVVTKPFLPLQADVRSILPIGNDSLLIATFKDGIFMLHNGLLSKMQSASINNIVAQNIAGACFVNTDRIAIITNLGGCTIVNRKGEFIQSITKREGLQNNNILCMLLDRSNNLWLGSDNGIDMIAYNNSIKCIFPEKEDKNSGYASLIHGNNLYMGVSTGLYVAPLDNSHDLSFVKGAFRFVENTKGKVWNLNEVNGKLFMAHTNGAYSIEKDKAILFDASTGFWTFQSLGASSNTMMAGTYDGIHFYEYVNGNFVNQGRHIKFESSKFIAANDGSVWMAHSYKGVFKVSFNEKNEPIAAAYKDTKKILSANHNHLYKVKDKVIVTSDNGVFEYDEQQKDFIRSTYYEKLFEGKPISFLKEDQYGNTWFSRDKRIGVIDISSGKPRTIYIPELNDKITTWGNEHINIVDSNNVFIAAERGFFHLNYAAYRRNKYPLEVLIRLVKSTTLPNGLIYGGHEQANNKNEIKYKGNSFHFEFASTLFAQQQNTVYSYRLKGFDKEWSSWSYRTEKDYTNLPAGDYSFEVKCRNSVDNESNVSSFSFTILPPWYQTIWAYLLYALLFAATIYYFYKRQQKKYKRIQQVKLAEQQRLYDEEQKQLQFQHQLQMEKSDKQIIQLKNDMLQAEIEQKNLEEEQHRLQFQHQLELEKNEKEIIQLKNEKLQTDIELKNTELASSAMHLVQKGELLTTIKEELMRLRSNAEIEKDSKDLKKMIKIIDSQLDTDAEWEQFAVHFDSVHTNYLKHLKDRFPEITSSELKLSAYLRLNLTSKEIAQLMNISIRGVETSRYRLRKKLGITGDTNLYDFLLTLDN